MKKSKGDLLIAITLIVATTVMAVLRFINDENVDGVLWSVVAIATLFREIRRHMLSK